ncbi:MAG: hypothetical protein WBM44_24810 [Waterburya sp.]
MIVKAELFNLPSAFCYRISAIALRLLAFFGQKWTIPIGGGFGRVFKIGNQSVNMQLQGFWNVVNPKGAADWTLRTQMTLLFPK